MVKAIFRNDYGRYSFGLIYIPRMAIMTQKLKRYAPFSLKQSIQGECLECTDGNYVTFADYQNLLEQLGKAESALRLISAPHCDYRTFETETVERLIECIIADTDCARQYFKEKEQE